MTPPDILTLVLADDPILRAETYELTKDSLESTCKLADQMLKLMYANRGVGLAAPQIGIPIKLFVMNPNQANAKSERIVINPKILHYGYKKSVFQEGCLSLPGIKSLIERPTKIVAEYTDINWEKRKYTFEGLTSRVFQHEIDHLNSILIIDRMSEENKKRLSEEINKLKIMPRN